MVNRPSFHECVDKAVWCLFALCMTGLVVTLFMVGVYVAPKQLLAIIGVICGTILLAVLLWAWPRIPCSFAGYKFGFLFQGGGVWLGVHYSCYNRRFCINVIPCCTLWIALPGGKTPHCTRV